MLDFLNIRFNSFGLDISDNSLRVAKIEKRKGKLTLVSFGKKEINSEIIQRGKIKNEDLLATSIKDLIKNVKGEKLKTKYVSVSLPEEKSFFHVMRMPKMTKEELTKSVVYEAENYIPLPINDVYLDFQIISSEKKDTDYLDILIVALPKKVVDPYISSIKKAGLSPVALEVESMSIIRSIIKKNKTEESTFLINIGETKTIFIVFSENFIHFTSSICISSKDFTDKIAEDCKTSFDEAEVLKIKKGILDDKIKNITMPLLNEITDMVEKHLVYYESHTFAQKKKNNKNIEKIIISGDGANLKGLVEFLFKKYKINVEIEIPFVNFLKDSQKISNSEALGYNVVFGLALRNFESEYFF